MAQKVMCGCGAEAIIERADDLVPCAKCGKLLMVGSRAPATTPGKCPNCGTPMGEGVTLCIICGHDLAAPPAAPAESVPPRASRAKIIVLAALAALLVGGALVGLLWPHKPEPPKPPAPQGYLERMVTEPRRVNQQMTLIAAKQCINSFYTLEGRYPHDLDELKAQSMEVPPAPKGMKYIYNAQTGDIALEAIAPPAAGK
jgi:hypothetical protein